MNRETKGFRNREKEEQRDRCREKKETVRERKTKDREKK